MHRVRCLVLVAAVCLLIGGCAFVRGTYGEEVNSMDLSSIKKGTSTRAEVATLLGAPERIVEVNDHEIFQYYRFDMKSGLLNLPRNIMTSIANANAGPGQAYPIIYDGAPKIYPIRACPDAHGSYHPC